MRAAFLLGLFFSGGALAQPHAPVRSLLELRRENVVVQKWDISCGAAALATLLTYQHGHPVEEKTVAEGMLRATDPLRVKHRGGFSLLDLKRFAQSRGFEAAAYQQVGRSDLEEFKPAIVPINFHGYPHFVIYRGRVGDFVLITDPAFGNRVMRSDQFDAMWAENIAFVVTRRDGKAGPNQLLARQSDLLRSPSAALRQAVR
jgi:uncharacterized protein